MLAIKKETEYAIHFLKALDYKKLTPLSLRDAAEKTSISFLFLQKIARKLRFAGLVKSDKGAHGGYILKISPKKLSLKKIIEVMEGGCVLVACAGNKDFVCHKKDCHCSIGPKMKKLNKKIIGVLAKIKLNDL